MSTRYCTNKPDDICYVCGQFIVKKFKRNISDFVKKAYIAYFKIKLRDQDKLWAPHIICKTCEEALRHWFKGSRKALPFGIPMVWRESKNHADDCYSCQCKIKGHNLRTLTYIKYPNLESAITPVPHGSDICTCTYSTQIIAEHRI